MKFLYLIQGQVENIKQYYFLKNRPSSEALFLSYDFDVPNTIFLPNSTWAEGRNLLLKTASEKFSKYDYFIFLDDDVKIIKGSFDEFEKYLEKLTPAVAVPLFIPKTLRTKIDLYIPFISKTIFSLDYQVCRCADAQFIAFHKDLISDNLITKLHTPFDKISWWLTSSTQQLLILNVYSKHFLQFNKIQIENKLHRKYTNKAFKQFQEEWFRDNFHKTFKDPRPYAFNILNMKNIIWILRHRPHIFMRCFLQFISTCFLTLSYKPLNSYKINKQIITPTIY
jgi:hypothetical protein